MTGRPRPEPAEWRSWMEDLDHLQSPPPVFARPVGLGSLGSESYFVEPYRIRSPHRVFVGDNVGIGARSFLSVIESFAGEEFEPELRIADDVAIGADFFVSCAGLVEIGRGAGLSVRVFIGDSGRRYEDAAGPASDLPVERPAAVRIGEGAVLGVGAMVLPGVTIGERALVGAGAVVTRDVPARSVVFGNPARVVRSWDAASGTWRAGG